MSDPGTGAAPVDGAAPAARGVAAVRLDGISKRYGRVVACDGVDMTLERGRVHGILGENGAGKSTLMKILIGLVQPDAGSIAVHGKRIEIADPLAASDLGIAMVHQHYSLVEPLTVWENVILGERVRLDRTQACERVAAISARYGLGVDPLATVSRLTAGQRQRVEIIKCLRREPRDHRVRRADERAHAGRERAAVLGAARPSSSRSTAPWRWCRTSSTRSSTPPTR